VRSLKRFSSFAGIGASLAVWSGWAVSAPAQLPVSELTRVSQIRDLTPAEADRKYPVRLKATVTFSRPEESLLFVQDDTAGIYVFTDHQPRFRIGQLLEVSGVTSRGDLRPIVAQASFRELGESSLPAPLEIDSSRFLTGDTDCLRVQLTGVVRRVAELGSQLSLTLGAGGRLITVIVGDPSDPGPDPETLVDAEIRVAGVTVTTARRGSTRVQLGIPNLSAAEILRSAPARSDLPLYKIGELRREVPAAIPDHRVRIQGVVTREWTPEHPLRIRDDTGTALVHSSEFPKLRVGERVEVIGFIPVDWDVTGVNIALDDVELFPVQGSSEASRTSPEAHRDVITRLGELRAQGSEQLAQGRPVRVKAVVTLFTRIWELLFIQDRTGSVYVRTQDPGIRLEPGQLVEIEGTAAPGDFAPILVADSVRVVGRTELPVPPPRTLEQMRLGREDCNLVEFVGLVRRVELVDGLYHFELDAPGGRVEMVVFDQEVSQPGPEVLEDSLIRVRAVCGSIVNANGQLAGVRLFLQDFEEIEVLERGLPDPFQLPVTQLSQVLRFGSALDQGQRHRVRGTVGYLSGPSMVLFDSQDALKVLMRRVEEFQLGDLVEAVGYPAAGQPSPMLDDSLVRRIGNGSLPEPTELVPAAVPESSYDRKLVRVRGWLLTAARLEGAFLLTLQSEGPVFHAEIAPEQAGGLIGMPANSLLELTGVYAVLTDEMDQPRGFKILLRDAADVTMLQSAPWITAGQALMGLTGLGLMVIVISGWVYVLRGRIRRHEERFRKAFKSAPMSLHMVTVRDGRIVDVNDSFCRLWGYSPEQAIGRREEDLALWEEVETRAEAGDSAASGQAVRDREIRVRTHSGGSRSVLVSMERFKLDSEECLLLLCHDITDRLNLEAQLRQAQKMESVGRLAAGVAHDFNNLLTVIQGHAQMLLLEPDLPQGMAESLRLMEESAIRGAGFTRQLLTFSRKQVVQRSAVNILQVVQSMADMLHRLLGEGIWLEIKGSPRLPSIDADPSMIEQMVMNLAVNARDAMPAGGTLSIAVSMDESAPGEGPADPADDTARSQGPGPQVWLTVTDTGVGMSSEVLPQIFDPFFTTKEVGKGTGLGLATVYGIVKQHSGRIEVQSREGVGTTFRISFPASAPATPAAPAQPQSSSCDGAGETVLIVEDEVSVRRLVAGLLQRRGFRVVEAASGPEAIRLWQQQWRQIDFLLSDMVMPGGISGLDLARNFRRERPDLPVILISGYSEHMIDVEVQATERVDFLPKPFPPGELVCMIRSRLDAAILPAPETLQRGA
jgi:two-component system, cell cycle sensor histidine kinase and response regulator CckA